MTKTKDKKMYDLLAEMREACHRLWNVDDPKAIEKWHILFDAHNDILMTGHTENSDIKEIREIIKSLELSGKN